MLRRLSNDVKPSETGSDHTYIQPLIAASTECVEACGTLQRVAPVLPLSSPFARDLHTLFYVVSNVETQLHHFIERELLQVRAGDPRSREHGARLQDALERAASSSTVKSTVKASLLAGGIASLLHLLTVALRRLNKQLNNVLEADKRGDAYAEMATAAAAALVLRRTARDRCALASNLASQEPLASHAVDRRGRVRAVHGARAAAAPREAARDPAAHEPARASQLAPPPVGSIDLGAAAGAEGQLELLHRLALDGPARRVVAPELARQRARQQPSRSRSTQQRRAPWRSRRRVREGGGRE